MPYWCNIRWMHIKFGIVLKIMWWTHIQHRTMQMSLCTIFIVQNQHGISHNTYKSSHLKEHRWQITSLCRSIDMIILWTTTPPFYMSHTVAWHCPRFALLVFCIDAHILMASLAFCWRLDHTHIFHVVGDWSLHLQHYMCNQRTQRTWTPSLHVTFKMKDNQLQLGWSDT